MSLRDHVAWNRVLPVWGGFCREWQSTNWGSGGACVRVSQTAGQLNRCGARGIAAVAQVLPAKRGVASVKFCRAKTDFALLPGRVGRFFDLVGLRMRNDAALKQERGHSDNCHNECKNKEMTLEHGKSERSNCGGERLAFSTRTGNFHSSTEVFYRTGSQERWLEIRLETENVSTDCRPDRLGKP